MSDAQQILAEERRRLLTLVSAGAFSIYRMSPDWRLMYELNSDSLAETREPITDWVAKYIPDEDLPQMRVAIDKAIATKSNFELEHRVRLANGGIGWVHSRAVPILDAHGDILEWFGSGTDATERKQALALQEREERYRILFERMDEAYAVVEVLKGADGAWADFRFLEVNAAFMRHTGMPWPVGQTATELLGAPNPRWAKLYGQALDTGESIRVEESELTLGLTFDLNIFPMSNDNQVAVLFRDITGRKQAEASLRQSEERQAFLLKLSDALRPLEDAGEIQATTTRLLGEHLGVDRSMYAEVTGKRGQEEGMIRGQFVRSAPGKETPKPFPAHFTYDTYGAEVMERRYNGTGLAVADVDSDPLFDAEERAAWAAADVRAAIVAPLVKNGRLVAELGVHSEWPRDWSPAEIALVHEAGERTWAAAERARAEEALRDSEERLRQFGDASQDTLWMRSAETLQWTYLTPAFERIYGLSRKEALSGDSYRNWLDLIVPEDRAMVGEEIARVCAGEHVQYDFRIRRRSDGAVRWLHNTVFPIRDQGGRVRWLGGIGQDITEQRAGEERQRLLLAELQHRVRNILALIRSLIRRGSRGKQDVEDYVEHLEGRIDALARTQAMLTRAPGRPIDLEAIVRDELLAQGADFSRGRVAGPAVALSPKAAEALTLAVHELATNSVKYGALGYPDGSLLVSWQPQDRAGTPWLRFTWREPDVPLANHRREGFGTELVTRRIPFELEGEAEVRFDADGLTATLTFPLRVGSSLLQTDGYLPQGELA